MIKINAVWLPDLSSFDLSNYEIEIPEELINKEISLQLSRTENFELSIDAIFSLSKHAPFLDDDSNRKAGEVYKIDKKLIMNSKNEKDKIEFGQIYYKSKFDKKLNPNNIENGKIRSGTLFYKNLEYTKDTSLIEKSSINWILNIDFSDICSKNCYMRIYDNYIQFEKEYMENDYNNEVYHDHRECFSITIDDIEIYVGKIPNELNNIEKKYKPGFIYFSKNVTEDFKEKILEALSFLFGRPLIKLGSSHFDEKGEVIVNNFISPYIIDEKIFNYPSHSPCLYSENKQKKDIDIIFDYDFIESFVSGFIKQYDEKNLKHVFWMYWHSVFSPLHIAAGSYGAIIEFILEKVKSDTTFIDKKIFKNLKCKVLEQFSLLPQITEDEETLKILTQKIDDLNKLSHSKRTENKFITLGINKSAFEKKLWESRNDTAHGKISKKSMQEQVRLSQGAFLSLCNRTILRVLNISEHYIDYYNYGFPVNEITKSIEDLEEKQKLIENNPQ